MTVHRAIFMKSSNAACDTRVTHTSHIPRRQRRRPYPRFVTFLEWPQMLALLSRIRGRPKLSLHSVFSAIQRVMPHARVEIDVEAGRPMTFRLAVGTTTCAHTLVWMQTPHGWFSTSVIESTRVPTLLSIRGPRALQATLDFATKAMSYRCINCSGEEIVIKRRLVTSPKGTCCGTRQMRRPADNSDNLCDGRFTRMSQ